MDFESDDDSPRFYRTPRRNRSASLDELQEQAAYTLDVDVEKGKFISATVGKKFYEATWLDREESPIVLIEMKGEKVVDEVCLFISLEHSHIIKTYGIVDPNDHRIDSDSILLLQEYAKDGDLGGLLLNRYFIPEQNVLVEIFRQVASAMIFLSESDIIHADLGCRNVLVFKSHPDNPKRNLVKLIDFGSTQNSSKTSNVKIEVPVRFASPEILRSNGQSGYSEKSDVYSFGVLMWEACSFGKMPYERINDDEEVSRRKLDGEKLTRPEKCDPNIWKLMNLCWNDRPANRPKFHTIHTQLENIQNVESSLPRSNSCLFEIEYEICSNCDLRYTDSHSHLNNCSEEEITCFKCDKTFRRAAYDQHRKNCGNSFDDDDDDSSRIAERKVSNPIALRPSSELNKDDSPSPESSNSSSPDISTYGFDPDTNTFISTRIRIFEISDDPEPRRPIAPPKPPQPDVEQIPCEICDKLIDASQYETHQTECLKIDKERIEAERKRIENETTNIKNAECVYCSRSFLVKELDKHQKTCSSNPDNVSSGLSLTHSISAPNLRNTSVPSKTSTSFNQSFEGSSPPPHIKRARIFYYE